MCMEGKNDLSLGFGSNSVSKMLQEQNNGTGTVTNNPQNTHTHARTPAHTRTHARTHTNHAHTNKTTPTHPKMDLFLN